MWHMQGMSERQYAEHAGLSRGAVRKAKESGRMILHADGSINAAESDVRRAGATDPAKSRAAPPGMKSVPNAAISAVSKILREQGLEGVDEGATFLQAKTANEILKAQEKSLRLRQMKGELIDRRGATALVFKLAREERDAWQTWPSRVAALMAAELGTDAAAMQITLESHVRDHLHELADIEPGFR